MKLKSKVNEFANGGTRRPTWSFAWSPASEEKPTAG